MAGVATGGGGPAACPRCGRSAAEDEHGGGEAVDVVAAGHGADLAGGEEAGDADRAERLADRGRVVVGGAEHGGAAAVAGEQQGAGDAAALRHVAVERLVEVLVGGDGV